MQTTPSQARLATLAVSFRPLGCPDVALRFADSRKNLAYGPGAGPETSRFNETLYTIGAIYPFDWSKWHHEAERLFHDRAALGSADEVTLRKLLTYHARIASTRDTSTKWLSPDTSPRSCVA